MTRPTRLSIHTVSSSIIRGERPQSNLFLKDGMDDLFSTLSKTKLKLAEDKGILSTEQELSQVLPEIFAKGGTIYVVTDERSRTRGEHFAEELQVRFRGRPERPDRPAVPCELLTELPLEDISRHLEARCRGRAGGLVVFASGGNNPHLAKALRHSRHLSIPSVVVAPESDDKLHSFGTHSFPVPSSDASILTVLQTVILHGLCEIYEPEFLDLENAPISYSLRASAELDEQVNKDDAITTFIEQAQRAIAERIDAGGGLYFFGNGGSACDAKEMTRIFSSFERADGLPIPANHFLEGGFLTCAYNDGFSPFLRGVEGLRNPNDVVVGISTSGRSGNVIEAMQAAKGRNLLTIALAGGDGGTLKDAVDLCAIVPSKRTEKIQEVHLALASLLLPIRA